MPSNVRHTELLRSRKVNAMRRPSEFALLARRMLRACSRSPEATSPDASSRTGPPSPARSVEPARTPSTRLAAMAESWTITDGRRRSRSAARSTTGDNFAASISRSGKGATANGSNAPRNRAWRLRCCSARRSKAGSAATRAAIRSDFWSSNSPSSQAKNSGSSVISSLAQQG